MAATTSPPPEPRHPLGVDDRPVPRFDRTERILHWLNAALFLLLVATGAVMYNGALSGFVGRRLLVRTVHVYSGLSLPFVFFAAYGPRWGRALRADLRRLNRWSPGEARWFRRSSRGSVRLGKFNPGQKLNAAFVLGALTVLLATGSVMHWPNVFSDDWKTGATFAHDWFALALGIVVIGHVSFGLRDQEAFRGITRGVVSASWARDERPRWYEETTGGSSEGVQ
jgi:formate dehydrogenase subunit gamma